MRMWGNPESRTDPTGQRAQAPDGSTSWTNPDGTIYEQSPGGDPTVIGHTHSGGSSGNGGGSTTQPTRPSGCTLSPAKCAKAENAKNSQIQGIKNRDQWIKVALGGLTLAADIYGFVKDLMTATGISKIIELIGDAISILGDLSSILSQVATLFQWNNAQVLINTIGGVISFAAGLYKLARGVMHSPWGVLAQAAILTGFYTLKAAFVEGDLALNAEIIMSEIVEKATGLDAKQIVSGVSSIVQAYLDLDQAQIASLTNESDDQFCRSNPSKC